ncbi:hypothetical protein KVV02_006137 [Mortierella alpina]|uniref:Peroxisomal biogenesis factor 11 n=1 Tax=Mortierella alpina TaxID=64518 RepID=A0A9P8ABX7_MORAP|nr:hypothetical protein KVV02_006137 [Mortierella alpina]
MSAVMNVQPWLKFTATTVGRDKLYRAVQYFSRFLAWYLLQQGYSKETVLRFNNLKKTLALSRKRKQDMSPFALSVERVIIHRILTPPSSRIFYFFLTLFLSTGGGTTVMRFGKPIEHVEQAVVATAAKDEFLRFCAVGKQLSYAGYLSYDALIFLDGAGAFKFKNIKRYTELANKFWLAGITFSFISGLYKTRQTQIRRESAVRGIKHHGESEKSNARTELKSLAREQHSVTKQLVQDGLDILIPSTGLGYLSLDDGAVGLIGTVTSIMGAQSQWAKVNKA